MLNHHGTMKFVSNGIQKICKNNENQVKTNKNFKSTIAPNKYFCLFDSYKFISEYHPGTSC
jgi:hypothetical protein